MIITSESIRADSRTEVSRNMHVDVFGSGIVHLWRLT